MTDYNEHIERKNNPRAGLIPYYINTDGSIEYLFMMPSNPKYGGPFLQISKGMIDDGETAYETAIRESEEEIGLRVNNCEEVKLLTRDLSITKAEAYFFDVFYASVKSKYDFEKPHYETKYTKWVSREEFEKVGRRTHVRYVQMLDDILTGLADPDEFLPDDIED